VSSGARLSVEIEFKTTQIAELRADP